MSDKPIWDTAEEGALPKSLADEVAKSRALAAQQTAAFEIFSSLSPEERLDRLDAMQAEAAEIANSRAAEFATEEQQFINTWQREATVASASLNVFQNPANDVEGRDEKVTHCKRTLATALYKLGRFDEALMVADGFSDLTEHIRAIMAAIDADDEEMQSHSCPRPAGEQDGKPLELDRRVDAEQVISDKHGRLVHVWQCVVCGDLNATPDAPERQQRYDATMLATIHAAAKGDTPNAKGIAKTLPQFEAGKVMVRSE